MIDIGANLSSSQLQPDLAALLVDARAAGVCRIIATGTSLQTSAESVRQAASSDGFIRATAGVHPHSAKTWTTAAAEQIRLLLRQPEVVAVGECGLDFNRMFSSRDEQGSAFVAQLELAKACGKPLFLHCRDAFDEFHALVAAHSGPRGVVHCFTGTWAQARAFLDLGFDIGVTGWVCDERRGEDLRDVVKRMPLGNLHLETDAPYLKPPQAPTCGKKGRNVPSNIVWVAREVARLRGQHIEEVVEACSANSARVFGL